MCFDGDADFWCSRFIDERVNHVSVVVETKPGEFVHATWTAKRLSFTAGAQPRAQFLAGLKDAGVIAVEYPVRDCWTPSIPPYTCVTLVKHVLGLGPRSLHVITPRQLLRYLRGRHGRTG
ncbi:MAG: hypothetical protein ACR2QF_03075 [Geminicoccaceae bacterium]